MKTKRKRIKGIQIEKEKVKHLLFAGTMIVCRSDLKNSTGELLHVINTYSNVSGYKINSMKSVALLYTIDKGAEREIQKTLPFKIDKN